MVMENRRNMQFVRRCAICAAITYCKKVFGKYWEIKSSNGVGCNYPIDRDRTMPPIIKAPIRMKAPVRPKKLTQQEFFKGD
jgi:hypothetical protein